MRIFIGIIGVVLSLLLIIYRVPIKHFIGNIGLAERYLGPGGTFTALVLIGILGFFFSLMYMTDTLDFIFGGFLNTMFGSVK